MVYSLGRMGIPATVISRCAQRCGKRGEMATEQQMQALLATACPWCGVPPGRKCEVRIGSRHVTVPSTLDGESHEARWQAALGLPARVMSEQLAARFGWDAKPQTEEEVAMPGRVAVLEKPW